MSRSALASRWRTACRGACRRASRLAEILGVTDAHVCSWHHQAIDAVGRGLTAVAWAADGVIEGVEHGTRPWCFGVQWHPEMQVTEPPAQRLFAALARAAAEKHRACAA
jgi:putative glutamine amidotransferase